MDAGKVGKPGRLSLKIRPRTRRRRRTPLGRHVQTIQLELPVLLSGAGGVAPRKPGSLVSYRNDEK